MVFNALIPARSGSKRVPDKNIRDFCGKPLMVWSIEQALESKCFENVYVSTDSEEYMKIAERAGAKVIDRGNMEEYEERPMEDVVKQSLGNIDFVPCDALVILQPTSPLREIEDIVKTIVLYQMCQNASLVSVNRDKASMVWDRTGCVASSSKCVENGAIYIVDMPDFKIRHPMPVFYEMPKSRSFEIDTEEDWKICEIMMKERLKSEKSL